MRFLDKYFGRLFWPPMEKEDEEWFRFNWSGTPTRCDRFWYAWMVPMSYGLYGLFAMVIFFIGFLVS